MHTGRWPKSMLTHTGTPSKMGSLWGVIVPVQ